MKLHLTLSYFILPTMTFVFEKFINQYRSIPVHECLERILQNVSNMGVTIIKEHSTEYLFFGIQTPAIIFDINQFETNNFMAAEILILFLNDQALHNKQFNKVMQTFIKSYLIVISEIKLEKEVNLQMSLFNITKVITLFEDQNDWIFKKYNPFGMKYCFRDAFPVTSGSCESISFNLLETSRTLTGL